MVIKWRTDSPTDGLFILGPPLAAQKRIIQILKGHLQKCLDEFFYRLN
jgi:hypothetical protein